MGPGRSLPESPGNHHADCDRDLRGRSMAGWQSLRPFGGDHYWPSGCTAFYWNRNRPGTMGCDCADTGDFFHAAAYFTIFLVANTAREYLEPRLIGDKVGVYPIVIAMVVYAGLCIYGVAGSHPGSADSAHYSGMYQGNLGNWESRGG